MDSSFTSFKGRAKKLRKLSNSGGVNTAASYSECFMHEIPVLPKLNLSGDISKKHHLMRDLQGLVLSVLHSMIPCALGTTPNVLVEHGRTDWVEVCNKAAVKHVCLLSLSDVPEEVFSPEWQPTASGDCFSQWTSLKLSHMVHFPADSLDAFLVVDKSYENASSISTQKVNGNSRWKDKKRKRSAASENAVTNSGPCGVAGAVEGVSLSDADFLSKIREYVLDGVSLGANAYPLPTDEASLRSGLRPRAYSATGDLDGVLDANALLDAMLGPSLPSSEDAFRLLEDCVAPQGCSTGYVQTLSGEHSRKCAPLVAIDCEMCVTSAGKPELTRVTVVGMHGEVLLDELVKPYSPIVDYCTRFSGITPELLGPITTRIEQIQIAILRMIDRETIIVGHSLENDLHALKIAHATVVDTALIFSSNRGPEFKPALRVLAREHLSRVIQASTDGHSSAEDALAALDLAKLKAKHGRSFGISTVVAEGINPRLLSVVSADLRCVILGNKKSLQRHSSGASLTHTIVEEDEKVTQRLIAELKGGWHVLTARVASQHFSIRTKNAPADNINDTGRIPNVDSDSSSGSSSSSSGGESLPTEDSSSSSSTGDNSCTNHAARLKVEFEALAKSVPPNTLSIIIAQKSTMKAQSLAQQRRACSNPRSSSTWSPSQEEELKTAVKEANVAKVFFHIS